MGLNVNIKKINLKDFANEKTLRFDCNYISHIRVFKNNYYRFKDLFEIVTKTINNDYNTNCFLYSEISNVNEYGQVNPVVLDFNNRTEENKKLYAKIEKGDIMEVSEGEILISKVRPYLKKNILIDENNSNVYFTTAFIKLKGKFNSNILYHCIQAEYYKLFNAISRRGKGYPTINEKDLFYLTFDKKITDEIFSNENELIKKIELQNSKIKDLEKSFIDKDDIIDNVFDAIFELDGKARKDIHKGMTYGTQKKGNTKYIPFNIKLNTIELNKTLRFSTRTVYPIFGELENKIKDKGYTKLKTLLIEPIHRGTSPLYDENGAVQVIKTKSLKNDELFLDGDEFVTEDFYKNKVNAQVHFGDLLIASTGKPSIGKVDICNTKSQLLADSHISIIRVDEKNININFLLYYLRSVFGTYQFEKSYVGLTNQIELYAEHFNDIIIPCLTLEDQKDIVDKINSDLNIQSKKSKDVLELRKKINEMMLKFFVT